jgi:hypothetical protein
MMRSGDIFNQNVRREINIFLVPWIPEEWDRFLKPAVLPEKLDQNLLVLAVFLLWVSDAEKHVNHLYL